MKHRILITGGNSGIGAALSIFFVGRGWNVGIVDRNVDFPEKLTAQIPDRKENVSFRRLDISDHDEVIRYFREFEAANGRLDALICNAGITNRDHEKFFEISHQTFRNIMNVNLFGTFSCVQGAAEIMRNHGGGNIIIVTSLLGQRGFAIKGDLPYGVSKASLEMMAEYLAVELYEYKINVNTVYPGVRVDTGFFNYLSGEERSKLARPEILNELAFKLATLKPNELTGKSINYQNIPRYG